MKKSIIAASAASLAIAALPVAGVFAATQSSVTDTVELTVQKTCQMEADAAANTIDLGTSTVAHEYAAKTGSVMTITCNTLKGWTLKATATALSNADDNSKTIPFGAYGTTSSVWSVALAANGGTGTATVAEGFGDYTAAAASNATVVSGNSVSGVTITPSYKAYATAVQEPGTYSGTITYTFAENTN